MRGGLCVLGLKLGGDEPDRNLAVLSLPSWIAVCFGGTLGVSSGVLLGFFLLLGFGLYPEDLILAGMSNFCSVCLKFLQYKLYCVHLLVIKTSV